MLAYVIDPTYSPAEKERALRRYNRALKESPRWEDDHNQFLLESDKEKSSSTTSTLGMAPDVNLKDMFSTMECAQNIDKCITNILMLKEVFEWMKQESENGRGLGPQAMAMVLDQSQRLVTVMKDEIDRGCTFPSSALHRMHRLTRTHLRLHSSSIQAYCSAIVVMLSCRTCSVHGRHEGISLFAVT